MPGNPPSPRPGKPLLPLELPGVAHVQVVVSQVCEPEQRPPQLLGQMQLLLVGSQVCGARQGGLHCCCTHCPPWQTRPPVQPAPQPPPPPSGVRHSPPVHTYPGLHCASTVHGPHWCVWPLQTGARRVQSPLLQQFWALHCWFVVHAPATQLPPSGHCPEFWQGPQSCDW